MSEKYWNTKEVILMLTLNLESVTRIVQHLATVTDSLPVRETAILDQVIADLVKLGEIIGDKG